MARYITKADVLHATKEVAEVKDPEVAAKMLQSDNWIIVSAAIQGEEIMWVLARI